MQDRGKAINYCLYMLGRREYSRHELRVRIGGKFKEMSCKDTEEVLDELAEQGWQSDSRFSESFVRMRVAQSKGPVLIRYELKQHKIPCHQIDHILEQAEVNWESVIDDLIRRKYSRNELIDFQVKGRIFQFLTRRGFQSAQIHRSFEKLHCH